MENSEEISRLKLAHEAEVRKRLIADCTKKIYEFYRTRNWEIFANKFRQLNVELPKDLFSCKICEESLTGHYLNKDKKVVLCANSITDDEFDFTITHELVHVFDDARAELNFNDPQHIACSEIRATNLSGECRPSKFYQFRNRTNKYMECVKSRATEAVFMNKRLNLTQETAKEVVEGVWDVCYYDYEPFSFEELRRKLAGRSF